MNKALNIVEENRWNVRRDIILGAIVAICITFGLFSIAKISLDGTMSAIRKNHLQPLKEVTNFVTENEPRLTTRDIERVIILNEDDIYDGWGKVAVRTILINNYFKEDIGQITIEALWSEEASESRSKFIKDHPRKKWFEPWIDDKQYELKTVHTAGRFCMRFSTEVSDEDIDRITDLVKEVVI